MARTQKSHNNKFTRGLNRTFHGAIVPNRLGGRGLSASAIAKSKKLVDEEDSEIDMLTRASVAGLDRKEQEDKLKSQAMGSDKAAAKSAIRTMKEMGMNSELRQVFYESDRAKKNILKLQSTDDAMMQYFQQSHRDMSIANNAWNLDGTINMEQWAESMANMTAPEVAATHKSAFKAGKGATVTDKDGNRHAIGVGAQSAMDSGYAAAADRRYVPNQDNNALHGAVEDLANNPDQYRRLHSLQQGFVQSYHPGAPYATPPPGGGTPPATTTATTTAATAATTATATTAATTTTAAATAAATAATAATTATTAPAATTTTATTAAATTAATTTAATRRRYATLRLEKLVNKCWPICPSSAKHRKRWHVSQSKAT